MDFKQLEAFQAVMESHNYSEAATRLYIHQSTVSLRLKALQEELGVFLFRPCGRKALPTFAGRLFARYASDMLRLQREALHALHQAKDCECHHFQLSMTASGAFILPLISEKFQRSFPATKLTVSIDNADSIVDRLLERKIDMGLVASPVEHASLCSEAVGNEASLLAASAGHPPARLPSESESEGVPACSPFHLVMRRDRPSHAFGLAFAHFLNEQAGGGDGS